MSENNWEILKKSNKVGYVFAKCGLCGDVYEVNKYNITSNKSTKCHKCQAKIYSEKTNFKTHGLSKKNKKLYGVWCSMKARCNNPNTKSYKNYGGRGIKVCDEWQNNFKSFYEWAINNGYKEGLEIDRIDNNGNYEPNNCRFITKQENISRKIYIKKDTFDWKQAMIKTGKTLDEIDDIIECATSGFFKSKELSDITKLERHTILRWVKASGLKPKWRKTEEIKRKINKILSKIVNRIF